MDISAWTQCVCVCDSVLCLDTWCMDVGINTRGYGKCATLNQTPSLSPAAKLASRVDAAHTRNNW